MLLRRCVMAALLGWTGSALALSADVSVGEDSARFTFGSYVGSAGEGRTQMDIGFLYNTDNDGLAHVGLHVFDLAGTKAPGLRLGVGGQIYMGDIASENALALALGGEAMYRIESASRLSVGGYAHYAPNVTSFLDSGGLYEVGVRAEYAVLPQASAYLGYRKIRVKTGSDGVTADEGGHAGLTIFF